MLKVKMDRCIICNTRMERRISIRHLQGKAISRDCRRQMTVQSI